MTIPNLIIGSGPAGIAAAMAFRRLNIPFEVIDVAYDLEPNIQSQIDDLAKVNPSHWNEEQNKNLFPPYEASINGVERRLSFGSDYPYRRPNNLSLQVEDCDIQLSHGLGGFGNVWGGAMLPYSDHALQKWPISKQALKVSYQNVASYVPISTESDNLQNNFPIYTDKFTTLERPKKFQHLLNSFTKRQQSLSEQGIEFGRARIAVDSTDGVNKCRRCGYCLDGCAYGSLFNPRLLWQQLESEGVKIHKGFYAQEFNETSQSVDIKTINAYDGSVKNWQADRVYLATGHYATARMIATSFQRFNETIKVADSQYFFFPYFSYRGTREDINFTLAEMFVEILNKEISDNYVHMQVYGVNQIVEQTLRQLIPQPIPLSIFTDRLHIFQGFLNSEDSGHLELTVKPTKGQKDFIEIKGIHNPQSMLKAKKVQSLIRKTLLRSGMVPPGGITLVAPGRSFHTGGSFPIGGKDSFYSSDELGRPANLNKVHIVDAANFPNVNGSTITFTIMANADRIVNAVAQAKL